MLSKAALPFLNQMQSDIAALGDSQETLVTTLGADTANNSWVGLHSDGKAYPIVPFDPAPVVGDISTAVSGTYYASKVCAVETLTDHFVIAYYSAVNTLSVVLAKVVNGVLSTIGTVRIITGVYNSTVAVHAAVDMITVIDGSDEKLVVAYRDSSTNYAEFVVSTIASDGLGAFGSTVTPHSVTSVAIRIQKIADNLFYFSSGTAANAFIAKVSVSSVSPGADLSGLNSGYSQYAGLTDSGYLIIVDDTEVHTYSYNSSTLACTEQDQETISPDVDVLICAGEMSDGAFYAIGAEYSADSKFVVQFFTESSDTITIGDEIEVQYDVDDLIGVLTDMTLVNEAVTSPSYTLFNKNTPDDPYISYYGSFTDADSNTVEAVFFRRYEMDETLGIRTAIDAIYGNLESTDYDLALHSQLTMINPCYGILMAQGVAVCVIVCPRIGYVTTGGDSGDTVTVYTKGYVDATEGHHLTTMGQGLVLAGGNIGMRPAGEKQALVYALSGLMSGGYGRQLAYRLGSKLYFTGNEVW